MVPVTNEFKFRLSNDDIGSIGNRNDRKISLSKVFNNSQYYEL